MLLLLAVAAASPAPTTHIEGIGALGIDVRSLIFQIINFGILLLLLRYLAYPRIIRILDQRRQRIAEGLATAAEMAKSKEALAKEREAMLLETRTQADDIVRKAQAQAQAIITEAEEKAATRAAHIQTEAGVELTHQTNQARQQLRQEAMQLVSLATEKIIRQKLDGPSDEALIAHMLAEAETELPPSSPQKP